MRIAFCWHLDSRYNVLEVWWRWAVCGAWLSPRYRADMEGNTVQYWCRVPVARSQDILLQGKIFLAVQWSKNGSVNWLSKTYRRALASMSKRNPRSFQKGTNKSNKSNFYKKFYSIFDNFYYGDTSVNPNYLHICFLKVLKITNYH